MSDIIKALANLPANREAVDADWLRTNLGAHPVFAIDPIETVELSPIGSGIGQSSELMAATVGAASGARHELIIKLQSENPDMHDVLMRYKNYEREARFYALLADKVPLRTPSVFVSAFDAITERVLIIMERIVGWHSPDQITGATLDEVRIATEQLARLTAAFWNSPLRNRYHWLGTPLAPYYQSLPADYCAVVDGALDNFAAVSPASTEAAARRIGERMAPLLAMQAEGDHVLTHWDYRVENMFYGPDGEFALIDWQLMQWMRPGYDFAYLIGTNIDVELRRSAEQDLIEVYLEELRRHGVEDYDRAALLRDMRLGLLNLTCIPIIGGASCDMDNPRSVALFGAIMARGFQMIEDWDAMAELPR